MRKQGTRDVSLVEWDGDFRFNWESFPGGECPSPKFHPAHLCGWIFAREHQFGQSGTKCGVRLACLRTFFRL